LSPYRAAVYVLTAASLQKLKGLDEAGRKVQMRSWKMKHPFDWGLAIQISLLILAVMAMLSTLIYSNYIYTR
jgi:hypothetical protein